MSLPSSIALTTIADDSDIDAAPHRNNYAAIQTAVNGLIAWGATVGVASGLTGLIASDGTTTAGTGFTSARSSAGVYVITFSPMLTAVPVVIAQSLFTSGFISAVFTVAPTTGGFTVTTFSGGSPTDCAWNFFTVPVS